MKIEQYETVRANLKKAAASITAARAKKHILREVRIDGGIEFRIGREKAASHFGSSGTWYSEWVIKYI